MSSAASRAVDAKTVRGGSPPEVRALAEDVSARPAARTLSAARTSRRSGGTGSTTRRPGRPIGSGPFLVERLGAGRAARRFVSNPRYWGPHPAYLDRLVFRFCRACGDVVGEQIESLRRGEFDHRCAYPRLRPSRCSELRRQPGVRVVLGLLEPCWEHFDDPGRPRMGIPRSKREARPPGARLRDRPRRDRARGVRRRSTARDRAAATASSS